MSVLDVQEWYMKICIVSVQFLYCLNVLFAILTAGINSQNRQSVFCCAIYNFSEVRKEGIYLSSGGVCKG